MQDKYCALVPTARFEESKKPATKVIRTYILRKKRYGITELLPELVTTSYVFTQVFETSSFVFSGSKEDPKEFLRAGNGTQSGYGAAMSLERYDVLHL